MSFQPTIYKLLNLQPGEGPTVALFLAASLCLGTATAVFFTCTTSLFLTSFDRQQLPLSFVASGALVYALGQVVQRLRRRASFLRVNGYLLAFVLVSLTVLMLAAGLLHNRWLYFALFLWNRVFVFVFGITFWATAGRIFTLEQAKRLFSFISLGEVIASIFSYLSVPVLLKYTSTERLLGLSLVFVGVCAALLVAIYRRYRVVLSAMAAPAQAKPVADGPAPKAESQSYYRLLFVLALLPVFGLIYVEFMFTVLSKEIFPSKEILAGFLGVFFGICAVIELLIKSFLYNRLISTYSIRIGIVLLPLALLGSYTLAALYGTFYGTSSLFFACIALSRFFMSSVRKSISEPAFQVLFQPIPAAERTLLQSRIEGGPKALGSMLPGLLLLVLINTEAVSLVELSYIFLLVLAFWTVVSFRIQGQYRVVLSEAVARSAAHSYNAVAQRLRPRATATERHLADQPLEKVLVQAQSADAGERRRAAVALGKSGRYYAYVHVQALLDDEEPAVREAALEAAGRLRKPELWPRVFEHLTEERYRDTAAAALLGIGEPILPTLVRYFDQIGPDDPLQARLLAVANDLNSPTLLRFLRANLNHPVQAVRDQVLEGLKRQHHRATSTERPYLLLQLDEQIGLLVWLAAARLDLAGYARQSGLLLALRHEKQQHVPKLFNLLAILYGDNQFDVISELITQEKGDIKGYLLELLSTTLAEEVKGKVMPLFADVPLAEKLRRCAANYPQQQLAPPARLLDIINKDFNQVSAGLKAVAMLELLHWPDAAPTTTLVASATSPDPVLAETALYVLHQLNPARFAALHLTLRQQPETGPAAALAGRVAAGLPASALLAAQLRFEAEHDEHTPAHHEFSETLSVAN